MLMNIMVRGLTKVFLMLIGTTCVYSASLEAEKASETVTLKLYQYSTEKWATNSKALPLQSRVAEDANTYCQTSPASCGLLYWNASTVFSSSDVGIATTNKDKNLEVTIYITFPADFNLSSVSPTTFVLNKAASYDIVTANKAGIETAIGLQVTYIDSTYYGIKVSMKENQIIIPIAFAVVIALIVVVVTMHIWQKRRTKKTRSLRRQEKHLSASKVSPEKPAYQQTYNGNWNQENTHQGGHVNSSPTRVTAPVIVNSLNEFTETSSQVGYPLPPLENEDVRRERKKKKKTKKKKKHREENQDVGSDSENMPPSYHGSTANTQQTTVDM
ncbi:uncharacterized protein LOC121377391 [Gigantopelta aegis]|uniref:uncharacterized protein LOC121377391 n=1 Tax=Gigantopelta aegis TaxID=1735272 RepID=UPI001B88D448|nr:uncharacterized protein LOC121377391 [Gigantopelta aegis]